MKHELEHAEDAGNGYHGRCKHCGIPLVTDLGYNSWAGVPCNPIAYQKDQAKRRKEYEHNEKVDKVFRLAFEYLRFHNNFCSSFTPEGWYRIRGEEKPSFNEVKRGNNSYKFDEFDPEVKRYILWNCHNHDHLLTIKNKKLVFRKEEDKYKWIDLVKKDI
ncbi:MAG: hypothetical protein M0R03_22950 [Novosphingobium sp.]|nr:hypothetical protein [Novosphingobium sp.]